MPSCDTTAPLQLLCRKRKEEMHGSFRAIILWNNVRRLVLKVTESERIDAHVGQLTIVAFLVVVPTMILRGMFGSSA